MTLVGIGTFFAQAVATGHVGRIAQGDKAAASGLYLSSYYCGGLFGAAVIGQLFDRFGWIAAVAGVFAALGLAAMLGLKSWRPKESNMSERYLRGVEIAQQLAADKLEEFLTSRVAELAPDFARMAIEFPFGDLYARDGARSPQPRDGRDFIAWLRWATPARTFGSIFVPRRGLASPRQRSSRS